MTEQKQIAQALLDCWIAVLDLIQGYEEEERQRDHDEWFQNGSWQE